MRAGGYLDAGTDLKNPNFARMAEAMGVLGLRAEDPAEVEPALRRALEHQRPALVDIVVNRLELAMPPKTTLDQAYGFSLWMINAVINGRSDEVVKLARSNLLR